MAFNRLTDRCDKCKAQAFVRVEKNAQDLLFCAHHFTKHEAVLKGRGFVVTDDEREFINTKPSVSASNQEG